MDTLFWRGITLVYSLLTAAASVRSCFLCFPLIYFRWSLPPETGRVLSTLGMKPRLVMFGRKVSRVDCVTLPSAAA